MTSQTKNTPLWTRPFRVVDLPSRHPTAFDNAPDRTVLQAIAENLGLQGLRKLRLKGEIQPAGKDGWRVRAQLGATVVQPCVITLASVTTRIEETVERNFFPLTSDYEANSESEMPDDDSFEPLQSSIDIGEIMVESLVLNLPQYPRADGALSAEAVFTEPGKMPMKDEDARPFAGLKALRKQLDNGSDENH